MPRRPRILYLITRGILGGAQIHVLDLVLFLKQEYDIDVAIGDRGPLYDRLREEGVPVYYISSLARSISLFKDIKGLVQVIKLFKKLEPDLVCMHSSKAGIIGRLAARLCHIPAIFTVHGWAFTEGIPSTQRVVYLFLERIAARWAQKIICVSEFDRQLALKLHVCKERKLITIHNGIPIISKTLLARTENDSPVRIIMVARFSEPKDQHLLLTAISQIQTNTAFEVILVGDGPLLKQCQEMVDGLGITDKVKFLGARADVPEQLARSHIFVLTSKWEGFPLTILEAMRAGLPVIASDVGGIRESVLEGETGFLIPRGDLETLESRLLELIEDPELRTRMGSKGHDRFVQHFTFELMAQKTEAVYREILSGKG